MLSVIAIIYISKIEYKLLVARPYLFKILKLLFSVNLRGKIANFFLKSTRYLDIKRFKLLIITFCL